MRIVYGVVGEGMGHATRSKVVIDYLRSRGHRVVVVASSRAYDLLRKDSPYAIKIEGLTNVYVDGAIDWNASVLANARRLPAIARRNLETYHLLNALDPQLAITDFESFVGFYARLRGIPLVSIDNIQIVARHVHDPALVDSMPRDYRATVQGTRLKLPECDRYLVTSFWTLDPLPECARNTTIVPPIVRESVVRARGGASPGGHVLVYQTSTSDTRLLDALRGVPAQEFRVYGLHRDERLGNCTLKPFSEDGFIRDLATSRAVIANGGMSLMGESVFLGKPFYSVPLKKQFEQSMNAHYLTNVGYGMTAPEFTTEGVRTFLERVPELGRAVRERHRQDGNRELYARVDETVASYAHAR